MVFTGRVTVWFRQSDQSCWSYARPQLCLSPILAHFALERCRLIIIELSSALKAITAKPGVRCSPRRTQKVRNIHRLVAEVKLVKCDVCYEFVSCRMCQRQTVAESFRANSFEHGVTSHPDGDWSSKGKVSQIGPSFTCLLFVQHPKYITRHFSGLELAKQINSFPISSFSTSLLHLHSALFCRVLRMTTELLHVVLILWFLGNIYKPTFAASASFCFRNCIIVVDTNNFCVTL